MSRFATLPIGAELSLASIRFQPWFDGSWPPDAVWRDRQSWAVTVELLDRKIAPSPAEGFPTGLQRYIRATVSDGSGAPLVSSERTKVEGDGLFVPLEALAHDVGTFYAFPDYGAYSPSWLAGYLTGVRQPPVLTSLRTRA